MVSDFAVWDGRGSAPGFRLGFERFAIEAGETVPSEGCVARARARQVGHRWQAPTFCITAQRAIWFAEPMLGLVRKQMLHPSTEAGADNDHAWSSVLDLAV